MESMQEHWLPFAVALGAGLLVGVERERRKGAGRERAPAGVRTFSLAALAGALAQWLGQPLLVAAAALGLVALVTVAYLRERRGDRGMTTEIALIVTYLLGVAAVDEPLAAGGVVLAALLAARTNLHRFSTEMLTEGELRDTLILAGAVLVVLPLVPNAPVGWLAGLNPRRLWTVVVIMLTLQAAGHIALRLAGPRLGLPLSGFAMGFVSSTATFAAMAAKARGRPEIAGAAASGALASNVATLIQLAVVLTTVFPPALEIAAASLAWGAAGAVAAALISLRGHGRAHAADPDPVPARALRLGPAFAFASLMSLMMAGAAFVDAHFGDRAAVAALVVAAAADVHASAASLTALLAGERIDAAHFAWPLLGAFLVNTAGKWVAASVAGGMGFAGRVAPGLALTVAGVAAPLLIALSAR